jgi:hypothetical protein
MAVGVEWVHVRHRTWLDDLALFATRHDPAVENGYEVLTYDLSRRTGPRRVARWLRDERRSPLVVGWDSLGIIVDLDERDRVERLRRIDPATGVLRPCELPPGRSLGEWRSDLNENDSAFDRSRRMHVDSHISGFYLWDPRSRTEDFLFRLPLVHEGYVDADSAYHVDEAAAEAFGGAMHDLWGATTRTGVDSVRVDVETYVTRPGNDSCSYVISLALEVPDPPNDTATRSATQVVSLMQRTIRLGPRGETLHLAVSTRRLRSIIQPYLGRMRRPTWAKEVGTGLEVELRRIPRPDDPPPMPGFTTDRPSTCDAVVRIPVT